jgi:hypothetical protein
MSDQTIAPDINMPLNENASHRAKAMFAAVAMICAAFGVTAMHQAQAQACSFYSLNTVLVNIRRDPGKPGGYIDVLERGDIACVTQRRKVGDAQWAFVKSKSAKSGGSSAVGGWARLEFLETAAAPKAGVGTASSQTPGGAQPFSPPKATPPPSSDNAKADNEIFRFDEPVPFGAFPVRGRTLQELAERTPLFSPIDELPDEMWQRPCSTCHKWNKERLCEQGKSYLKAARYVLRHQHPYGGPYKLALMRWAKTGCQ